MVKVQLPKRHQDKNRRICLWLGTAFVIISVILWIFSKNEDDVSQMWSQGNDGNLKSSQSLNLRGIESSNPGDKKAPVKGKTNQNSAPKSNEYANKKCNYQSISQLTQSERYPKASKELDENNRRHMVDPPADDKLSLVCCQTTAGPISIAVHNSWAPLGAQHFLYMVREKYFSSKVAFMRCMRNFICQFGISGDPKINKYFDKGIKDDPNWLPEGPDHWTNEVGAKRFAKGYFAYAGSGDDSRGNQLIVALDDNKRLAGGSPWEVPWGEAVGKESYETLDRIYTGYGDKGPPQHRLRKEGSSEKIAQDYPELDYVLSCTLVDEIE